MQWRCYLEHMHFHCFVLLICVRVGKGTSFTRCQNKWKAADIFSDSRRCFRFAPTST